MDGSGEKRKNDVIDQEQLAKVEAAMAELTDKMFKQGMVPSDAAGLDPQFLESLYSQAYRLYNTGKYIDAAQLFRTLILMNSMEGKYVLGLAACFHMLKEYKNAIQSYTLCNVLDPQDPMPYYYSSDCYVQMKDPLSAVICLEMAISTIGNQPEYTKVKERALLTLEGLKRELIEEPSESH